MFVTMLPGVGVTYNGEEIGMENGEVTWEQGKDPGACNGLPEDFDRVSRDFERTPIHWDSSVNAGFNEDAEPWLPVSSKYHTNNLAQQIEAERSHFKVFQACMNLRKSSQVLASGELEIVALAENVISIRRSVPDIPGLILLFNKGMEAVTVDVTSLTIAPQLKIEINSVSSTRLPEDLIDSSSVILGGYEALIVSEV